MRREELVLIEHSLHDRRKLWPIHNRQQAVARRPRFQKQGGISGQAGSILEVPLHAPPELGQTLSASRVPRPGPRRVGQHQHPDRESHSCWDLSFLVLRTRDYLLLGFCVLLALGIGTLDPRSRRLILLGINYVFKRTGFHHLNEDFDNAIRGHTIALQKNPNDISHLVGRALAYLNLRENDLSLADLDRVLQLDPKHLLALEIRGELHSLQKEYDPAMECFNRVKALKPEWAFPYFDIGGIYLEKKDYEGALTEFNRAIALDAQYPLFFLVRSMTYFRMQNLDAAHRDQAEAIRLSPQHALTMSDVNLTIYEGYLDWARDYYGWVLAKYPKQWMAYQGRADAFVINHQLESAITDYDRAVNLAPKEAILYFRRGMAQTKLGNSNQAEMDFQRVIKLTRKSHLQRRAQTIAGRKRKPTAASRITLNSLFRMLLPLPTQQTIQTRIRNLVVHDPTLP